MARAHLEYVAAACGRWNEDFPGLAGTTAPLRFEYAQDDLASCSDVRPGHACGVLIDNVQMTSFKARR